VVGQAVSSNGDSRCDLFIENNVTILREKDIMSEDEAGGSPCRRIYFLIQLMYIDRENNSRYHQVYADSTREILEAAPSTRRFFSRIDELISSGKYYEALKATKDLLKYEEELLRHVQTPAPRL